MTGANSKLFSGRLALRAVAKTLDSSKINHASISFPINDIATLDVRLVLKTDQLRAILEAIEEDIKAGQGAANKQ